MQTRITISALYGTLAESVSGVRAVQSMSREGENSRRFDALNEQNRVSNNWAALWRPPNCAISAVKSRPRRIGTNGKLRKVCVRSLD